MAENKIKKGLERKIEEWMDIIEAESFFKSTMSLIGKDRNEIADFRINKDVYKKFKEEWIPLYYFVKRNENYKSSKFRIILGNQGFDGEIRKNTEVIKIEITRAINGKKFIEDMRALNSRGYTDAVVDDLLDGKKVKLDLVESTIDKKLSKDYSDTVLLVTVDGFPEFGFEEDLDLKLIEGFFEKDYGSNIMEIYLIFINGFKEEKVVKIK